MTMRESRWFGREAHLALLAKRVQGFLEGFRQNCAIVGPEGIGKSTLLKRFVSRGTPRLAVIYLEIREGESIGEWTARFLQSLWAGLLQAQQVRDIPDDLSLLFREAAPWIPKTCLAGKRLLERTESQAADHLLDLLWDLPHSMTQESGIPSLVILDEFQRLKDFPWKDPFRRLGRKIMVHNGTMYIVASSRPSEARGILREGFHLLFGQFEVIEMHPLEPAECLEAIRDASGAVAPHPFMEHLLVELSQGYPGGLNLLLAGWLSQSSHLESPSHPERSLLDLLEKLFLEPEGELRDRFEARLRTLPAHRSRRFWIQVLSEVAAGFHRAPQIAELLRRVPSQVVRALQVLERNSFLIKQGVFYSIPDRLFQLWLLTAYPILQGEDWMNPVDARVRFREAAWVWMDALRGSIRRPLEEQVLSLVRLWGGELVEMDGRRMWLPRFHEVELREGPAGRKIIVAHQKGRKRSSWLLVPWTGSMEEGQARQCAQEVNGSFFRTYRKVLLGADFLEINARLILQEAHVRLWDLSTLNLLLDLYGCARIPVNIQGTTPRPGGLLGHSVSFLPFTEPASSDPSGVEFQKGERQG